MPMGEGRGQNVGIRNFCQILTLLPPGASVFYKHVWLYLRWTDDRHKQKPLYTLIVFCTTLLHEFIHIWLHLTHVSEIKYMYYQVELAAIDDFALFQTYCDMVPRNRYLISDRGGETRTRNQYPLLKTTIPSLLLSEVAGTLNGTQKTN